MSPDSANTPDKIIGILERLEKKIGESGGITALYGFGEFIRPVSLDSPIRFTDERSDFTHLGEKMKTIGADYSYLLTDGIATTGTDPASLSFEDCPPVTVLVFGDEQSVSTIGITKVRYPQSLIQGDTLTVDVSLSYFLDQQTPSTLRLLDSNHNTVSQKLIKLGPGEGFTTVTFSVPGAGLTNDLTLDIIPAETHVNLTNNQYPLQIDIQSEYEKVLLLSGSLSFNSRFIRNRLTALPRVEVEHYFRPDGISWNTPPEKGLEEIPEMIVLDDFPNSNSDRALFNRIVQSCTEKKIPLIYFEGPGSNRMAGNLLVNQFHLTTAGKTSETKVSLQAPTDGVSFIDFTGIDRIPPQQRNLIWSAQRGNIVEYSDGKSAIFRNQENFPFTGIFMPEIAAVSLKSSMTLKTNYLQEIVDNLFLLELLSEKSLARLKTDLPVYDYGDVVELAVTVNATLREAPDLVQVKLTGEKPGETLSLPAPYDAASGTYKVDFVPRSSGKWTAVDWVTWPNGEVIAADSTNFTVREIRAEDRVSIPNYPGLKHIAESTKGAIFRINALDSMINSVKITPVQSEYDFQFSAISLQKFWAVLILLLGIEWWLRKRNGLL
ncbi:MAG: hypothetical protein GXO91_08655 [FCB group bacterium]|nr:hypothetical protein [FCB group bacterium]